MDYTKNYHLPQWVKSDRIMMDDFNRMCADIENGLTNTQEELRQVNGRLSGQIQRVEQEALEREQSNSATVQEALQGGLFHMAYNHYHLLAAAPVKPWQIGFFHQKLGGPAAPAAVDGWLDQGWALWLPNGAGSYSSADFLATIQQTAALKIVKGNPAANKPLVMRFTPPGPGCITQMPFQVDIRDINSGTCNWHIALFNTETGEYENQSDFIVDFSSYGSVRTLKLIKETLHFSGGVAYQIEISSRDDYYDCTASYDTALPNFFKAESQNALTAATLTRTFSSGEMRQNGAVLVQYRTVGKGGTLALTWDGRVLSPSRTRTFLNSEGRHVTEAMFLRNGSIPASTQLRLNANANAGGEIFLYSWGMISI